MYSRIEEAAARVRPVDDSLIERGRAHLDSRTKPVGSLGRLEELALKLYLIADSGPPRVDPVRVCVMAGDHGVVERGVSCFPQEVTRQMVGNFLAGGAGVNVLARVCGAEVVVADCGVAGEEFGEAPGLVRRKVAGGTADLSRGPAMSPQQCAEAVAIGLDMADQAALEGVRCLVTGDMGIANTTPSTALFCAYLGLDPQTVTGPGTGLDAEGVSRKAAIVAEGLAVNAEAVSRGPLDTLAALGGFEIAALAGLVLGGAANRQTVVVDGFISTAAYLAARAVQPLVEHYCVLAHDSAEPGYRTVIESMGESPLLNLGFRLGEGTGAVLGAHLLRCAAAIWNEMAGFEDAGVAAGS
jgi:nicotinate-nucleotide--dimethylbenzimidazole phosphoribosyltransferase